MMWNTLVIRENDTFLAFLGDGELFNFKASSEITAWTFNEQKLFVMWSKDAKYLKLFKTLIKLEN